MIIHKLFPEPIYFSKLGKPLTKKELGVINKCKKKTYKNKGNSTSLEQYVLEHKLLKNLKKDLHKIVVDYFDKIVCARNSIIPYITQSWLNYTQPKEEHHKHFHANSYVSGVFYIDAKKEVDQIKFYKMNEPTIELNPTKYNSFNSTSWWYAVETGDVVLFPSSLIHGVDRKKGTNTRISLSFNVFMKGKIGNKRSLTELVLR